MAAGVGVRLLPFVLPFAAVGSGCFETVSGFTTTGATVMANIEIQPQGILFWRSLTHWLGGMGIIVFTLAVLPALGLGTMRIFQAESPGPAPAKLVSRVDQTAKLLYGIYLALTIVQIAALKLTGWSWFDAVTHTFAMGTGGFSTRTPVWLRFAVHTGVDHRLVYVCSGGELFLYITV